MLSGNTPKGSRGDILPYTLSEVFALLFFILALFLALTQTDLQEIEADLGEIPTSVRQGLGGVPPDVLSGIVAAAADSSLPDTWTTLVSASDSLLLCRSDASACRARSDSVREVLDSIAVTTGVFADSTLRGLEDAELADSLRVYLEGVANRLDDAAPGPSDAREERNPSIESGLQGIEFGGVGPCWSRRRGAARPEIVYVLNVVMRATTVEVDREWPEGYQAAADTVPNLVTLSQAGAISYPRFRELAIPVLQWSKIQDPECRHFVMMYDSVESVNAKDDFKVAMLTVEDFFYKYLVR